MPYMIIAVILVIAGLIVLFLRESAKYYGKIFSDEHYAEVGNWLHSELKLGPVHEGSPGSKLFQSSAGCGFTFTRDVGEKDHIHIAISQIGHVTTHAVCNRLAFLILQILKQNKAGADFFYTESGVHHLVFAREPGGEWITNQVAAAIENMRLYQPLPFHFESTRGRS